MISLVHGRPVILLTGVNVNWSGQPGCVCRDLSEQHFSMVASDTCQSFVKVNLLETLSYLNIRPKNKTGFHIILQPVHYQINFTRILKCQKILWKIQNQSYYKSMHIRWMDGWFGFYSPFNITGHIEPGCQQRAMSKMDETSPLNIDQDPEQTGTWDHQFTSPAR